MHVKATKCGAAGLCLWLRGGVGRDLSQHTAYNLYVRTKTAGAERLVVRSELEGLEATSADVHGLLQQEIPPGGPEPPRL